MKNCTVIEETWCMMKTLFFFWECYNNFNKLDLKYNTGLFGLPLAEL